MDPIQFLTTTTPGFGPLSWIFFISQIVLILVGGYFGFVRRDTNSVRGSALRQLGYALLALGIVGTLVGGLRLGAVDPFTTRLWFFLVGLLEVALAIVALVYSRRVYPAQVAAHTASKTPRRVAQVQRKAIPASAANAAQPVEIGEPRPSVTGRRDARRDRKRRKK